MRLSSHFVLNPLQAVPQMSRVHSHKAEEAASSERCERAPKQRENEKYGEEIQHEKPKQQQQVKKGLLDGPRGVKRKKTDGADSGDEVGGALDATLDDAIEGAGEKAEKIKDRKRGDKNAPRVRQLWAPSPFRLHFVLDVTTRARQQVTHGPRRQAERGDDPESTSTLNVSRVQGKIATSARRKPDRPEEI